MPVLRQALYDGNPGQHQDWAYRVINITTGKKNLQQCADVVMRLRAEYFFSKNQYDKINFATSEGIQMSFENYSKGERFIIKNNTLKKYQSGHYNVCYSHDCLMNFLDVVFSYCGTYSIKLMTDPKPVATNIAPGDVLVRAGSPGHAMMVADVAVIKNNKKIIFSLLQGFMPAQDMHIVQNLQSEKLSPWYEVNTEDWIVTPGYMFAVSDLLAWK